MRKIAATLCMYKTNNSIRTFIRLRSFMKDDEGDEKNFYSEENYKVSFN